MLSVLIYYQISTHRKWMCRSCGLAIFRAQTSKTLVGCWWGFGLIGTPIIFLANRIRLRRVLCLAPPQPNPGVAAHSPVPLDPGKPVLARPSGIFALVMCALILLSVAAGIAGSAAG